MIDSSKKTHEFNIDELDAVIGAGSVTVSPNEQISAHFLSVHGHTSVQPSRYRFPGKSKH